MSMFDPAAFLDATIEGVNDTKVLPVPEGEYLAIISEVKARSWQKKDDPSKSGITLDVTWEIGDTNVKATLGRDKITCRQGVMLDITDSGSLDMGKGKNISLGRLREAVGLNHPGQPFAFSMLQGRMGKIKVSHDIQGEDVYARVTGVAGV